MTQPDDEDPLINSLPRGLGQPLVKSWRLGQVGVPHLGARVYDESAPPLAAGIYVDPGTGVFYARVPETADGTLYAAETYSALEARVRAALSDLAVTLMDAAAGQRVWERRISVWFKGHRALLAPPGGLKGEGVFPPPPRMAGFNAQIDATPCPTIPALLYGRFERSLRPEGNRYDTREWQEDYEARLAAWQAQAASFTQEEHRNRRPQRVLGAEWVQVGRSEGYRSLPWSGATWARLGEYATAFETLHSTVAGYLLSTTDDELVALLLSTGPKLLGVSG